MKRAAPPPEDAPEGVPGWVLSFGDMVTNLMACFVLLQSMASTQDKTLFNAGLGSFRQVVARFGMPSWLFGKQEAPNLDYEKLKYPTEPAEQQQAVPNRVVDAEDEEIRQIFSRLKEQIDSEATEFAERPIRVEAMPVAFTPGEASLPESLRDSLRAFATNLKQNSPRDDIKVYVIARAEDVADPARQWAVSAGRAAAAAAEIKRQLAPMTCEIHSWGAGPGSDMERMFGPQSTVVIAVTAPRNRNG